ncbi:MAG: hypothetical protein R3F62_18810 [Planctomycetota bacterium]
MNPNDLWTIAIGGLALVLVWGVHVVTAEGDSPEADARRARGGALAAHASAADDRARDVDDDALDADGDGFDD